MRILIHTERYLPTMEAVAIRMDVIANQLRELGHQVTVITGNKPRSGKSACGREGVIYAPTVQLRKKTNLLRLLNNVSFSFSSVFCSMGVGKCDVVITTSPPPLVSISGWLIAKMKGAKLVYDVRDIWPDVALEMGSFSEDSFFCRFFRWITSFMYRKADLITTVSPGKVINLRKKLDNNSRSKVWLIANGYDLRNDVEPRDESAVDRYELRDRFTCVYIGNLGYAQGLESLLEIAANTRHKNIQFLIFGNGVERETLERKTKERGLNQVRFCGNLPHEQVAAVLTHAKISYIPLKNGKMKDSVPTKLYESLAMGCPVLLAASGDSANILDETGFGLSVSPDCTEAIVAKFDEMVEHYDLIYRKREAAMQIIREKHSRQSAVLELERLLQRLVLPEMKGEVLL